MSLHLFEEVCVEPFLNASFSESKLSQMILAMGELHNQGLASLAISYFESTKKDMERITEGLTEENGNLKKELLEAKDTLFANTMRELNSMQLAISGINHKLRRRVYQLGRVQKIAEVLESEAHLPRLLKMASYQVLALCPENSNLFFAFFDEERKKVNLYHQESKSNPECDLIKTFYFSELPGMFQQVLFDESTKLFHLDSHEEIPAALSSLLMIKNQKDFLLMPIRKYREVTGFMLLGVPAEDFFSKSNYKFYQHVGQVVSKSVTSAALFTKSKQRDDFELIISELTKRKFLSGTLETTLDFCLGSLIDLLGVERSSLMRYDEGHMNLAVYAAKGYKVYPISGSKIKFGEGIAGMALKEAKIISIDKMKEVNAARPEIKVKSLLCVPLIENDTPLGVVNMSTISYYKHFEKSDIEMAHHVINRMTGILKELNQNTPTSFI
ncbi:MAG: hypothetical protein AUJ72_01875 [Candidatus Omnitrophica bacterium CG1_02_46_14]|nr:MAG: hypothetical protein AUJ72_01875 [Candidatus Omnitrophica bacterium CG1_02_46_14]